MLKFRSPLTFSQPNVCGSNDPTTIPFVFHQPRRGHWSPRHRVDRRRLVHARLTKAAVRYTTKPHVATRSPGPEHHRRARTAHRRIRRRETCRIYTSTTLQRREHRYGPRDNRRSQTTAPRASMTHDRNDRVPPTDLPPAKQNHSGYKTKPRTLRRQGGEDRRPSPNRCCSCRDPATDERGDGGGGGSVSRRFGGDRGDSEEPALRSEDAFHALGTKFGRTSLQSFASPTPAVAVGTAPDAAGFAGPLVHARRCRHAMRSAFSHGKATTCSVSREGSFRLYSAPCQAVACGAKGEKRRDGEGMRCV